MEQLKVGIGADVSGLEKGLKDAEKALKQFSTKSKQIESQLKKNALATSKLGSEISKLDQDFKKGVISQKNYDKQLEALVSEEKRLSAQSKVLRGDLAKLNASTKDLGGKGFASAKKGAANAVPAMNEFSRVIQDAPFGIQGVANNITQLTQQFGYLTRSTGSSSAALKAMLGTLTGPAGILLVISAVTSLLVSYGDELFSASKDANALTDAQKDLVGSTKVEINTLNQLLSIAKDERRTKRERQLAINKLQELYPDYLKNITLEGVNSEKTSKNVDLLSKALLRQAKIKGAQNKLSELYAQRFEVENKAITKQIGFLESLWVGVKNYGDISKAALEGVERASKNQRDELSKLDVQINKIQGSIKNLLSTEVDFDLVFGGNGADAAKSLVDETFTPIKTELTNFWADVSKQVAESPLQNTVVDWTKLFNQQQLAEQIIETEKKIDMFNQGVSNVFERSAENLAIGFGQAIGNALATGGSLIDSLGSVILGSLGSLLTQVGKMAIAIGVGLKAIRKALESLNPAVAIAAGVGLVALGSFFSSKSKSIGSSIGGSGSSGSSRASSTGSGFSAPRASTSSNGGFGGGTVVFEIAGNKLVGVLSNTLQRNRNLGGTLQIST